VTISFACEHCGKKLKAPERLICRRINCPACDETLEVVAPAESIEAEIPRAEPVEDRKHAVPRADNPFADDWLNSDDLEDPKAKKLRIAERNAKLEAKRAERDAEEIAEPVRKKKAKTAVSAKSNDMESESGQPFRFHWLFLLGLAPLTLFVIWPREPLEDRIRRTIESLPIEPPELEHANSLTDILMALPDHRISGALLARDSLLHWFFGILTTAAYLGLLFAMFPGARRRTFRLLRVGVFTGTIGIVMLLTFQLIASATQAIHLRGRGIFVLVLLLIQLIGFSYRCAEDPSIGFWGSFFGFTIGVGLCEELCKSVPIWHYLRSARKIGWRGACLTGLASGIGFGISEGIMYSGDMYNGVTDGLTYLVRFVSCVSLHAMWSGSVALMMYRNQHFLDTENWSDILFGLLYYMSIAMVLHGLYDTLLKREMAVLALLIGIGSYLWMFYLVRQSRGT